MVNKNRREKEGGGQGESLRRRTHVRENGRDRRPKRESQKKKRAQWRGPERVDLKQKRKHIFPESANAKKT